ncbi:hypothetical protein AVEN_70560-1 [Araneus ventricosus]|uniref:Uncharacterized protein n=1 Tax=Araneus ventricosus TaxID=182803 RepID=A0A4Y2VPR3_ARAVE|nr:hypothetical protein AVEN_70560-1 [Araneus ventricosus]
MTGYKLNIHGHFSTQIIPLHAKTDCQCDKPMGIVDGWRGESEYPVLHLNCRAINQRQREHLRYGRGVGFEESVSQSKSKKARVLVTGSTPA